MPALNPSIRYCCDVISVSVMLIGASVSEGCTADCGRDYSLVIPEEDEPE